MKNNIFFYATKELSQDAFICWLMSYAMKNAKKDEGLCQCAKDLIRQFVGNECCNELWVTNIQRQYKSIDVLITVNDRYLILIEDKTYTNEHDDQLARYKAILEEDFPKKIKKCVFWKIGFQSDISNIIENGYLLFERYLILNTLEKYSSKTNNQIFLDYYEFIKELDYEISLFKELPVIEWKWQQINGFYDYIKKHQNLLDSSFKFNYGYVANQSGGFYGMWISNETYRRVYENEYELYLQIEFVNGQINICYKASAWKNSQKINGNIRSVLLGFEENGKWIDIAKKYKFNKPSRYGSGKTVTLGVYDSNPVDYKKAIDSLKKAINSFKEMVKELE